MSHRSIPGGYYIGDVRVQGSGNGALQGLSAVVKDCYDVEGFRTSNGSPLWLETHPVATRTAPAVQV